VAEPGNAAPVMRGLEDIAALAATNHAPVLKVHIENDVHLVRLEQTAELGRLEFRPGARAPRTLAGDLQQKLRDWTGLRWSVSVSNDAGAPTLAEQKKNAKAARIESVAQTSLVRAVLDRFPGAEIVAVRDVQAPEAAPAMPEKED
jgi:DNA polymerase-3 subunit gamma/tau